MHEYAITKAVVDMTVAEAVKMGGCNIDKIYLVVGELSGIMDESVQMYFDVIAEDTLAQGATLIFKKIEMEFYCEKCKLHYKKPKSGFDCPRCGESGNLTGKGKEFYIEKMEVNCHGNKDNEKDHGCEW